MYLIYQCFTLLGLVIILFVYNWPLLWHILQSYFKTLDSFYQLSISMNRRFLEVDQIIQEMSIPSPYCFQTSNLPEDSRLMATVANGHLATVVNGPFIHVNGVYNGARHDSHRARIPSPVSFNVYVPHLSPLSKIYQLDVQKGIFVSSFNYSDFTVKHQIFAHRQLNRLLISQVTITLENESQIKVNLTVNSTLQWKSEDIHFYKIEKYSSDASYIHGQTQIPETDEIGTTNIHIIWSNIPKNLILDNGRRTQTWTFITCFSTDKEDAEKCFMESICKKENLLQSHIDEWTKVWNDGNIYIDPNENFELAQIIYSGLYYILSSLPLEPDFINPFIGLSPGSLAYGIDEPNYLGHVFWDQESWMFTPILMLFPNLANIIIQTRLRTLDKAKQNAVDTNYKGARFPWESAYTGVETCPWQPAVDLELHVMGDIALAFDNYLQVTNNTSILTQGRSMELIECIAEFWASKVIKNDSSQQYEILDVMPPDEWNYPVNNSVYTNYAAIRSLRLPSYAYSLIGKSCHECKKWEEIADHMYLPFDEEKQYHPEFFGFSPDNQSVKQADVILLGFPLMMPMNEMIRKNDLIIYNKLTNVSQGPAMTWSMFAIGWLEIGYNDIAAEMLYRSMANAKSPFMIWTEETLGTGAVNFITGIGGFLQAIIFGYGGIRIYPDRLDVNPQLLPNTTKWDLNGLHYRGNKFDINIKQHEVTFTVTQQYEHFSMLTLRVSDGKHYQLLPYQAVKIQRQSASIIPLSKK